MINNKFIENINMNLNENEINQNSEDFEDNFIDEFMDIDEEYERFYNYITETIINKQEKEYISNIKPNYNPNNIKKYKMSDLFRFVHDIKYLCTENNESPIYPLIDIIGNEYVEVEKVKDYYYEDVYLINYECRNEVIKHYPGKISVTTNCNVLRKIKDFDNNINLPYINKQLKKYFKQKYNRKNETIEDIKNKNISWSLNDIELCIYTDYDSEYSSKLLDFDAEFPYINRKYFEKHNLNEYFEIIETFNNNNSAKYIIDGKYPVISNNKFNNGIVGYLNEYSISTENDEIYTLSYNGYLFKLNQNFNIGNDILVLRKIKYFDDDINLPAITYQLNKIIKMNESIDIELYIYNCM